MFAQQLAYGKVGESRIANWLKGKGYHVLPVYEIEMGQGKGPQLFTAMGKGLVAPDLLVFKGQQVRWIEAKHKTVFSWHRMTQQWVTGIDLRHYNDYLQVLEVSPWPVWLLFLHSQGRTDEGSGVCPTGLYGGELSELQHKENHRSDKWGKSGMVYWAHSTLKLLAPLTELSSPNPPTVQAARAMVS